MSVPIVDCHSHVFNAEDLPIDGFIKKLSPAPSFLTGILSVPLDRLTQWVATKTRDEAEFLASILAPQGGLEAVEPTSHADHGTELITDAEIDDLFRAEWSQRGWVQDNGLEGVLDGDVALADGLGNSPTAAEARVELDVWLRGLGDEQLDAHLVEESAGLEGFTDWYQRIRATKRAVQRFVAALRLVTKDRHLIASELATTYPSVALFVPALVDFEYTSRDKPSSSVIDQVRVYSLLSKLSVVGGIPGAPNVRVHSFVGFCPHREVANSELVNWDPAHGTPNRYIPFGDAAQASDLDRYRPELTFDLERARQLNVPMGPWDTTHLSLAGVTRALDIVRHAIELGGFLGVKLYPPAGFLPLGNSLKFGDTKGARLDAALRSLYAYCERMEVPILAHASHSNGFEPGYDDLAGPNGWGLVLKAYPGLRLCFGHFGHLYGIGDSSANPAPEAWARRFVDLIDTYPNVYADVGNSRFPIQEDYRNQFLPMLHFILGGDDPSEEQSRRRKRVMFGSDYWMNTLSPKHEDYLTVFDLHYRQAFGDNAAELFMGGNALGWLGIVDEDGQPNVANVNRQRLVQFYGSHPRPGWLM